MDTGCASDLISEARAKRLQCRPANANEMITFATANGTTSFETTAATKCSELNGAIDARVLPDTPSVLSIGRRCMHEGCAFVWPPGGVPYLVLKNGDVLLLQVQKDIPHLRSGDRRSTPFTPSIPIVVPRPAPFVS